MTKTVTPGERTPGWILEYRKSGKIRRFTSFGVARRAHIRAAARYGTRWLSLRRERT